MHSSSIGRSPSIMSTKSSRSSHDGSVLKFGYLKKKGSFGRWTTFYFVLTDETLSYKTSEKETNSIESFPLESLQIHPAEHLLNKKFTFGLYRKEASPVYCHAKSQEECDEWMNAIQDKGKTKKSAFVESIGAMLDCCVVSNEFGIIVGLNEAAIRMFGYSQEEAIGQPVAIMVPSPYKERHDSFMEKYRQTGNKRLIGVPRKLNAQRKDGSIFPMELSLGEIPDSIGGDPNEPRYVAIMRDLTGQRDRSSKGEGEGLEVVPEVLKRVDSRFSSIMEDWKKELNSEFHNLSLKFQEQEEQLKILREENARLMKELHEEKDKRERAEAQLRDLRKKIDSVAIEELFADEVVFQSFLQFLKAEKSEENLMFWKEVEDFKATTWHKDLERKAQTIYNMYIDPDAPLTLNIDTSLRKEMLQKVKNPTRDVFNALQKQITRGLKEDKLARFLNTDLGRTASAKLEAHKPVATL